MFAIVNIAGQQFKVKKDDELFVHRLEGGVGDKVEFSQILMTGNEGSVSLSGSTKVQAEIIDHLKTRLNLKPGETTKDGKFSLTVVECLGACEIAPVMQYNKEYKGLLNKKQIDELIDGNK